MTVTHFYFQGSPNCLVTHLALERKGIAAREVELPMGVHAAILRALGFRPGTVPAARIDGRRVQGSSAIMRELDALVPEPPLFGSAAVEEAERWGAEYVQSVPRRIVGKLVRRAPSHAGSFMRGGLAGGIPRPVMKVVSAPTLRFQGWRLRTGAEPELLAALGELPGLVDRVGGLLAEGTLSSEAPTAADLQIAPQLRILMCFDDLAPVIEARPAVAAWARAVVPEYPGRIPPVLSAQERAVLEGA